MEHVLTGCGMTEDAVELALTTVEEIREEAAAATVEERLRSALRHVEVDESGSERQVRKVMGKLHDEIKRVLRDQSSAIQTYAPAADSPDAA